MSAKSPEEVREYNREYYNKRKELISQRRKQKYWSDSDYRASVRNLSRNRYRTTAKSTDPKIGYTVKRSDGIDLYTIKYAAQVTGKKEETIRSWEKTGIIPASTYTDSRGWRLYTAAQIELLANAFRRHNSGEWTKEIVRDYLKNNWDS